MDGQVAVLERGAQTLAHQATRQLGAVGFYATRERAPELIAPFAEELAASWCGDGPALHGGAVRHEAEALQRIDASVDPLVKRSERNASTIKERMLSF